MSKGIEFETEQIGNQTLPKQKAIEVVLLNSKMSLMLRHQEGSTALQCEFCDCVGKHVKLQERK